MTKRRSIVGSLLLAQLALVAGCLNHPRNGQVQPSKSASVAFDGYYLLPSQVIHPFILNNVTGNYDPIPHAPIVTANASQGYTDNSGTVWYSFGATDVVLPSGSQYWSAGPAGSYTNVAHVKAIGDNPPNQPQTLNTFDVAADTCINAALQQGGLQIATQCHSAQEPVVTLNASCGTAGGDCCLGSNSSACKFGENCNGTTCSNACGSGVNAPCCFGAPWCGPNTVCKGQTATQPGVCAKCGDVGDACCANNSCPTSGTCKLGVCECGGLGEKCCAVTGCGAGLTCDANHDCVSCGTVNSICCANNSCNGSTCVPSTPPQCACGQVNEACCPGKYCVGSTCSANNVCLQASQPAPQCSAIGAACGPTAGLAGSPLACCNPTSTVCDYNICRACLAHGAVSPHPATDICCTFGEQPVLDPQSGKTICGIPDGAQGN